jgi:hypothetical protein
LLSSYILSLRLYFSHSLFPPLIYFHYYVTGFFILPNPFSRNIALG